MANVANVYTNLLELMFAQAIARLRKRCIMPRVVRNYSDSLQGKRGQVITVPKTTSGMTAAAAVTSADVYADPGALTFGYAQITLDQWVHAGFTLDDQEITEIVATSGIPVGLENAVDLIANHVDAYIMALYKGIANAGCSRDLATGGAGDFVTPSAFVVNATHNPAPGIKAFLDARALMIDRGVPLDGWAGIISAFDESDMLGLPIFSQAEQRGDQGGVIQGFIGHKFGVDWYVDQNVPTHTCGTLVDNGAWTGTVTDAAIAAGDLDILVAWAAGTADNKTLAVGDTFKFFDAAVPGISDQTYTLTAANADIDAFSGETEAITFVPALDAAHLPVTTQTTVGFYQSHKANLLLQRDAIGFASRPLADVAPEGNFVQMIDPVSGVSMRLEMFRQYKRTIFDIDVLYGATLLDEARGARIMSSV
jgi:hypothetical protein